MKSTGGLPASEHVHGPGKRGIEGWRHRQACPNHKWEENKDDEQVCDALEHVVCTGFGFVGWCKAEVFRDYASDCGPGPIRGSWKEILPKVTCAKTEHEVNQSGY